MYEYRIVPAPPVASRSWSLRRRVETPETVMAALVNEYSNEGWEFQRSEFIPGQRYGWIGRRSEDRHILVFRRQKTRVAALLPAPDAMPDHKPNRSNGVAAPHVMPTRVTETELVKKARSRMQSVKAKAAERSEDMLPRRPSPIEAIGGKVHRGTFRPAGRHFVDHGLSDTVERKTS
ncbi:MAG: hypothetical protein AAGF74_14020 [Pseudomonadota bacterium]